MEQHTKISSFSVGASVHPLSTGKPLQTEGSVKDNVDSRRARQPTDNDRKPANYKFVERKNGFIAVLLLITLGSIGTLVWKISNPGDERLESVNTRIDALDNQTQTHDSKIKALEKAQSNKEAEHDGINNQVVALVNQSDTHVAHIDRLDSALSEMENELNRQTHDFVNRTATLGSKIDVLETALSETGDKLVKRVSIQIDALENQTKRYYSKINALEKMQSELEAKHSSVNNETGALVNQFGTLVAQIDRLDSALSEIEHELGKVNTRLDAFGNQTNEYGSNIHTFETALVAIDTGLYNQMGDVGNKTATLDSKTEILEIVGDELKTASTQIDALWNQTDLHGSKIVVLETTLSERGCTLAVNSTTTNDDLETMVMSSTPLPTSASRSTSSSAAHHCPTEIRMETAGSAFKVLKTGKTVYKNYSFLALQVRVPYDGLSSSENWCRDYENLCKHFGRRPTGCGVSFITTVTYKDCAALYNSDMNIRDDVLGCSPTVGIAGLINTAFPGWSPMVSRINSFGFYQCKEENCEKTIKESDGSLPKMADYWVHNKTTMYTVCR